MRQILLVFFIAFVVSLNASEGKVFISKDINKDSFSKTEITEIFLGKKINWDNGTRINIGYSIEDEKILDEFLKNNVGKNYRRYKKYWIKKVFAGYGVAPKLFKRSENAFEFLENNSGTIVFTNTDGSVDLDKYKLVTIY